MKTKTILNRHHTFHTQRSIRRKHDTVLTYLWCFCISWLNITSSDSPVRVTSWRVISSWQVDSLNCVASIARCCFISSTLPTKRCISLTDDSSIAANQDKKQNYISLVILTQVFNWCYRTPASSTHHTAILPQTTNRASMPILPKYNQNDQ